MNTQTSTISQSTSADQEIADKRRSVSINLDRLQGMGMVTNHGGRTNIAEDFRIIKRPLIRQSFDRHQGAGQHSNLIVVTSALPREGKTFCAINLAMSIAMERDFTVLLVDADVARPSVLKALGIAPAPGLMDILLSDHLTLSDVILRTDVDALSILPAGRSNKHATELLASQAMSTLLAELASRYPERIIIFDSPPLLLTSEASVLASQMGQVVVVVDAETTTQQTLKDALGRIETSRQISLVYNKTLAFPSGGDYHGYYE